MTSRLCGVSCLGTTFGELKADREAEALASAAERFLQGNSGPNSSAFARALTQAFGLT